MRQYHLSLLCWAVLMISSQVISSTSPRDPWSLEVLAKRQAVGPSSCLASCSDRDRDGLDTIADCTDQRCLCDAAIKLTSPCFECLTGTTSVEEVRQFHHSCGLYPSNPSLQRCSSICLSNRATVNAFAACPLANTECYCEVFLGEGNSNLPCLDCLALAINSNMTAADLQLECAQNILPNSASNTFSVSTPASTATGELPLSSGALGSAYTSVVTAASASSVAGPSIATAPPPVATSIDSGSPATLNKAQTLWMSLASMVIGGLGVLAL